MSNLPIYILRKKDLEQYLLFGESSLSDASNIIYSLLEDTPEFLEFKHCRFSNKIKYKDRNLKISIAKKLFSSSYVIKVGFCGLKARRDIAGINTNQLNSHINEITEDIINELRGYFILPKDDIILSNKDSLSRDFTFITLVIAYNSGQDTYFKFDNGKIATTVTIEFLKDNTTKLSVKNFEINTKCYYNYTGTIQDKVLNIIHMFN